MSQTHNLQLPYLFAAQSQKHVTHNEALRMLDAVVQLAVADADLVAPPPSPTEGQRFIVASGASGAWAGRDGQIAAFQDGAWAYYAPVTGWRAWISDQQREVVWTGVAWVPVVTAPNPVDFVGVNTLADPVNRLAVKSDAVLVTHDDVTPGSGDTRLKLNKADTGHTASLLLQQGFSGRAEIGLTGDDDLHVKVSGDGVAWRDALVIARATGEVQLPATSALTRPNLLLNGDFGVNQRGFAGGTLGAGAYGYDRWKAASGGASLTLSGSVLTLASGEIQQVVEPAAWGLDTLALTTVTISVEAPSADLTVTLGAQTATIGAGAGRRSATVTVGAGETGPFAVAVRAASPGAVTFGRVKLEVGSAATAWQARPVVDELRLCQRYFYRRARSGSYDVLTFLSAHGTNKCWGKLLDFPVPMRATPAMTLSNIAHVQGWTDGFKAFTAIAGLSANATGAWIASQLTTSGTLAVGDCVMVYFANTTSGYIDADAEL